MLNQEKIDDYTLALMYLVSFKDNYGARAWKGFDRDTLDRLHDKGFISSAKTKAKSVSVSAEGEKEMQRLFEKYFTDKTQDE